MGIGKRIRERRKAIGISQSQLAKKVHITQSFISKIEREEYNISADLLYNISKSLDISITELFGDDVVSVYGLDTLKELENLCYQRKFHEMVTISKAALGSDYFKEPVNRAKLYQWKATAHALLGEHEQSLCIATSLRQFSIYISDATQLSGLYAIIGINLYHMGDNGEALSELKKAKTMLPDYSQRTTSKLIRDYIYLYLGLIYQRMGEYEDAKKYLKLAAEKIDERIELGVRQQCEVLRALFNVEINNEHYESAIEYIKEYMHKCEFVSDTKGIIRGHAKLGLCYKHLDKLELAHQHFQKASELAIQYPKNVAQRSKSILFEEGYL